MNILNADINNDIMYALYGKNIEKYIIYCPLKFSII